jgi:hypothetical protein
MRFGSRKAILHGAQWSAADRTLEARLNEATKRWLKETGGPELGDVDPDFTTALTIGLNLGGRIHRHLPAATASVKDPYRHARQMGLF